VAETLAIIFLAHGLGDFVFQTRAMVRHKRHWSGFTLHILTVWALTAALLGQPLSWEVAALGLAHGIIDNIKTHRLPNSLAAFLVDQGAHIVTLLGVAILAPDLWRTGFWVTEMSAPNWLPALAVLLTGAILATRAGGFAVALLMRDYPRTETSPGLDNAGAAIGLLERALIFFLVAIGQPAGIGFLVAAKSILRFDATAEAGHAEYVIIGTLASFGWALVIAFLTMGLLTALDPAFVTTLRPTG